MKNQIVLLLLLACVFTSSIYAKPPKKQKGVCHYLGYGYLFKRC